MALLCRYVYSFFDLGLSRTLDLCGTVHRGDALAAFITGTDYPIDGGFLTLNT